MTDYSLGLCRWSLHLARSMSSRTRLCYGLKVPNIHKFFSLSSFKRLQGTWLVNLVSRVLSYPSLRVRERTWERGCWLV